MKSYDLSPSDQNGSDGASFKLKERAVYINGNNLKALPKGTEGDNEANGEEEKKPEKMDMVGTFEVFRFADTFDRLLLGFGVLFSCVHGAIMPIMIIVFGNMADTFVNNAQFTDFWNEYGKMITDATNITKEDLLADPNKIMKICKLSNQTEEVCEEIMQSIVGDFNAKFNSYTLYYAMLGVVTIVISYIQLVCWNLSSYRQCQRIRVTFFRSILRQEVGWFDTHEVAELNTRLADDVMKIQEGIGEKLGLFFQWLCAFFAGLVVGFVHGWQLTLVILAVSPLLALSAAFLSKLGSSFTTKELDAYAKAGAVAEEVLGGVRTVVAFGGQEKECKRYNNKLNEAMAFGIRKGMVNGGGIGFVFLVLFCMYALAFWYGAELVRTDPAYTPGRILTVFFGVIIGAFSLGNAAPNIQYFASARGAAHTIYNIIDYKPIIDNASEEGQRPSVIGNIEFRDVHFSYPSRPDVPILKGLNLKVNVGQTVALVGPSGCGKSTTVQLIQRFYEVLGGQVLLDGTDIRELNVTWLRQNIGVVSQEPILFGTTIGENIRYGKDNVTQEEILSAAQKANAYDFIQRLPKRFDTLVGERGAQLSGGQKQRIAIARALVRDPKILLLDEATSALDTESEATVQAALDKARLGRTTIVIAHRLTTIQSADVIASFEDGVLAEEGTHDELMEKEGLYYTLVMNQTQEEEKGEKTDIEKTDIEKFEEEIIEKLKRAVSNTSGDRASFKRSTSGGRGRNRTMSGRSEPEEEEEEEKLSPPSVKRIASLNSPEWLFIMVGCIAAIVSGSIQPIFAFTLSEIISVFAETDLEKQKQQTDFYCIMFAVIGITAGLAMFLQSCLFAYSGEKLTMRLRRKTFSHILRMEIGWFDDKHHSTGALTTRLATDASMVKGATGSQLAMVLQGMASITIGVTIGFIYSAKLAAVILAFGPFVMAAGFIQMKVLQGNATKDKKLLEEAGKTAIEAIENIRTVASLTKERAFYEKYEELTNIPFQKNKKKVHLQGVAWGISQGIIFFAYAVCFKYGAHLVEYEQLPFGDLYKVITAIMFSAMSVGQASSFAPDYGKAKAAASHIFTIWDRDSLIDIEDKSGEVPTDCNGVISFKDVVFSYPTRPNVQVLKGLTLSLNPGETLALVGSSGCGKSTTVLLMERFYTPASGFVHLDKWETRELQLAWLRSQIGIVSQEPTLFDYSIRENIEYGDNSRKVSMDEVINAAEQANIHNFITSLPQGYETKVGGRGTQLSGGQKQRVAIARALVRNPKILLLDEATSALDTESEKIVQEALDRARLGRTCIVIAHRLSTIRDADNIAVIHNGQVAEQGSHNELMAQKTFYYRLNNAQAMQS